MAPTKRARRNRSARMFADGYRNVREDIMFTKVPTVLMFMQFLSENHMKPSSIRNYISGITTFAKWLGLQTSVFSHHKVTSIYSALDRTICVPPKFKGVSTIPDMINIIQTCNQLPHASMFKCVYLLAFFGFLRLSNVVPTSKKCSALRNTYVERILSQRPIPS